MKLGFHKPSFFAFLILLVVEVCIALFVHDRFIRPFIGDVLVICLIAAFIQTFTRGRLSLPAALGIFAFACLVEVSQYFQLASRLNLPGSSAAGIALGATFDWLDILAYAVGTFVVIIVQRMRKPSTV